MFICVQGRRDIWMRSSKEGGCLQSRQSTQPHLDTPLVRILFIPRPETAEPSGLAAGLPPSSTGILLLASPGSRLPPAVLGPRHSHRIRGRFSPAWRQLDASSCPAHHNPWLPPSEEIKPSQASHPNLKPRLGFFSVWDQMSSRRYGMGGEVWGWGSGGHPREGVRGAQTEDPGPPISPPGFKGPVFFGVPHTIPHTLGSCSPVLYFVY